MCANKVPGYAFALVIHQAKNKLCIYISLRCRQAMPLQGFLIILGYALPNVIYYTKAILCICVSLFS